MTHRLKSKVHPSITITQPPGSHSLGRTIFHFDIYSPAVDPSLPPASVKIYLRNRSAGPVHSENCHFVHFPAPSGVKEGMCIGFVNDSLLCSVRTASLLTCFISLVTCRLSLVTWSLVAVCSVRPRFEANWLGWILIWQQPTDFWFRSNRSGGCDGCDGGFWRWWFWRWRVWRWCGRSNFWFWCRWRCRTSGWSDVWSTAYHRLSPHVR